MNNLNERIKMHPFFRGLPPAHLDILTISAKETVFEPDSVLFRETEPANQFYLIEEGTVALEAHAPADGTVRLLTLRAGDVMGWSWLFPPFAWHFKAHVIERTKVIALNAAHLLVTAEHDKQFGFELMKRVAQLVIRRLQAAREQMLRLAQARPPEVVHPSGVEPETF